MLHANQRQTARSATITRAVGDFLAIAELGNMPTDASFNAPIKHIDLPRLSGYEKFKMSSGDSLFEDLMLCDKIDRRLTEKAGLRR